MRIIRFQDEAGTHYGEPVGDGLADLLEGDVFDTPLRLGGRRTSVSKLLAPVVPPAIVCVGLNYRQHAAEVGAPIPEYPVVFLKAPQTLQNPGDSILLPAIEPVQVDYEGELAIVIGKTAKNVSRDAALSHVLGYTCANDVSGRSWQLEKGGRQWCRGKGFDTFCPLGPAIVTTDEIPDPGTLAIRTILNGVTVQESNTRDMIFDVPTLVSFLSQGTTLLPGTVILTGTPSGVGFSRKPPLFLKDGDTVVVTIERIGSLDSPVQADA